MQEIPVEIKSAMVMPFLEQAGLLPFPLVPDPEPYVTAIVEAAGDRIKVSGDILDYDDFFTPDAGLAYDEKDFAKRVQAALLPLELPRRLKGVDVAAAFAPARELGGDFHDFLLPQSSTLIVALGDVSGKGVPAALYSVFAAELVRSRTFRGRYLPERSAPGKVLSSINTILHDRQLEEYYCTLCYVQFDLRRRRVTLANSGLPYPIRASGDTVECIELPGVPLGSFSSVIYDEVEHPLEDGDVYVLCSDGVHEAMNARGEEFGSKRLMDVVRETRGETARGIVTAIEQAVERHRGGWPPNDDMTIVVLRCHTDHA